MSEEMKAKKMDTDRLSNLAKGIGASLVGLVILGLMGLVFFRIFFVTMVDAHELGFTFNRLSGEIKAVERNGWVIRAPWAYDVNTIDLRPYQVSISANARILNAKLVRFNPDGLETFISWHGRNAGEDTENLKEILKCYAFDRQDGKDCPFLIVVSEISPDQGALVAQQ